MFDDGTIFDGAMILGSNGKMTQVANIAPSFVLRL